MGIVAPDDNEKAEEIFCVAVEKNQAEARAAFLDKACATDSGLRAKVEVLLTAHEAGERLLAESSAVLTITDEIRQTMASDPAVLASIRSGCGMEEPGGTQIGPYRLLDVVGQGGCGIVYLALQEAPVRREVALKIIKLGMDTRSVIARFDAERQALAMMEHPNIARVLDAGTTELGRPFFVMDLVRGVRITHFCDEHRLNTPQRLELFVQVCSAIQHAHQKGIIHRDIKPSNVLVTMPDGAPRPMVIDFGIAKAVEGRLTDETITSVEHFIGTPSYMSPEQAQRGRLDVDTRSDIYSLGVLLYELLSGRTPFDTAALLDAGIDEMRQTLKAKEPPRPSAMLDALAGDERRAVAESRREALPKLIAGIRGDLDWIVMKAIEKDRDRRYQTVNGLSMDVQRYLDGEPVLARPPSRMYRLQKLILRNKLVFGLGAAAVVLLVAGLASTSVLLMREHRLRQEQVRLRIAAERGMTLEAELRRQAEWREALGQAATLIFQNNYAEADWRVSLLDRLPPTSEGTDVFRRLAEWNVLRGDWAAAKKRYESLLWANRLDNLDLTSLDLLATAAAILKSGDAKGYEEFRRGILSFFQGTSAPMVADRVVKSSLLRPASAEQIAALQPFAEVVESHSQPQDYPPQDFLFMWRCHTLALWHCRNARFSNALVWADRLLAGGEHPLSRSSCTRAVRAMALQRLGRTEEARSDLERARKVVGARFEKPLTAADPEGLWFDWVISELLLEEAAALIEFEAAKTVLPPSRPAAG